MEDRVVCHCFDITYEDIKQAYDNGYNTLDSLQGEIGIGNACGACIEEVYEILNELAE